MDSSFAVRVELFESFCSFCSKYFPCVVDVRTNCFTRASIQLLQRTIQQLLPDAVDDEVSRNPVSCFQLWSDASASKQLSEFTSLRLLKCFHCSDQYQSAASPHISRSCRFLFVISQGYDLASVLDKCVGPVNCVVLKKSAADRKERQQSGAGHSATLVLEETDFGITKSSVAENH